ncbi:MAG TPA: YbaN family protein [Coriobacteriia bacterium]|nr:YbaN family protein [Coriobacteriia bacterium]
MAGASVLTAVNDFERSRHYAGPMRLLGRHLLFACGVLALGLGVLGLVLPLLPTTPFVLLAAACFMRSSERLHTWLTEHPVLGHHISDYLSGRGLRPHTKVAALSTLWISVLASTTFFVPVLLADLLLVATAAGISVYLLRLPTCRSPV